MNAHNTMVTNRSLITETKRILRKLRRFAGTGFAFLPDRLVSFFLGLDLATFRIKAFPDIE